MMNVLHADFASLSVQFRQLVKVILSMSSISASALSAMDILMSRSALPFARWVHRCLIPTIPKDNRNRDVFDGGHYDRHFFYICGVVIVNR